MSIAHSFMRIHIHRACFMSIARYEHSSYFGPMYEHSSYYDNGFIIDELMLYLIMLSCFHDPYPDGRDHTVNCSKLYATLLENLNGPTLKVYFMR